MNLYRSGKDELNTSEEAVLNIMERIRDYNERLSKQQESPLRTTSNIVAHKRTEHYGLRFRRLRTPTLNILSIHRGNTRNLWAKKSLQSRKTTRKHPCGR